MESVELMRVHFLASIFLFLFIQSFTTAQTSIIRGNVYDESSGSPVAFATALIEGTSLGAATDIEGFFNISGVPPGKHKLIVSFVGYQNYEEEIEVKANKIIYRKIDLAESGIELETVQVSAEKVKAKEEVQVSTITLTPKKIRALPSTGGVADIAQYLPVLPGVIFTGDQGGQLYIRGGSPIQNKILLDGMTIYNPFHSLGFFSVFETELIRSVDVLTGGFSAEYGGRISAIVDIKTREGNKKRFAGNVAVSPFQSKVVLEGPIIPQKENGGSTSFLITGKHSYIDETSKFLYDYAAPDSLGLPYNFTDIYGKLSLVSGNGSLLDVFGFNFRDNVNFAGLAKLDWKNTGGGARFKVVPGNSNIIINGRAAFTNYETTLDEEEDSPRNSSINSFNVGMDFTVFGAKTNEFTYGFEINGFNTDFVFRNTFGNTVQQEDFTTELSGYFKYRQKFGDLVIEPSFRLQYYASLAELSPEPRLGLKYNITDWLRFKAAGGMYSQNLISSVSEEDVVNLFVGFLAGPEQALYKPGSTTEESNTALQTAWHAVGGFEIDATNRIQFNVEPYYKGFTQLITLNRNKLTSLDPDFVTETGEAYGLDLSMKYETPDIYVWLTYSHGYVKRDDGEQIYPTIFDRRHNVNALVTYNFGPENEWEASGRWNMGSGFPFTQTQGFYQDYPFDQSLSSEIIEANGELGIIFDEKRNGGRLPYYHRLDLSLKRSFEFGKYTKLDVIASATNAYDRDNIFYFDRVEYERINQLPIIPSLGIDFKF